MSTDPGDLVLDPTCGGGTTAFVAEQWGRRWITCDTSRVAIQLAKQRLMTAKFDYYEMAQPTEGVSSGFKYKTSPQRETLTSLKNSCCKPSKIQFAFSMSLLSNTLEFGIILSHSNKNPLVKLEFAIFNIVSSKFVIINVLCKI